MASALTADSIRETAAFIASRMGDRRVAGGVVLGSGLGEFADTLADGVILRYADIPHFASSTVQGHAGRLVAGNAGAMTIACMQGRFHYYEGHPMASVVYPMRVLRALGARFVILTNAAGGVNPNFSPGSLMLMADHLNLMGSNPLIGPNDADFGPRFPDMSAVYDPVMRAIAADVARESGFSLESGIYAAMSGPSYETPAEIRMLRSLGADAVGMSTVPEAIVARHCGMQVLGVSCITNPAAGLSQAPLSHEEVMEAARQAKGRFMTLLSGVLAKLAVGPDDWNAPQS